MSQLSVYKRQEDDWFVVGWKEHHQSKHFIMVCPTQEMANRAFFLIKDSDFPLDFDDYDVESNTNAIIVAKAAKILSLETGIPIYKFACGDMEVNKNPITISFASKELEKLASMELPRRQS